MFVCVCVQYKDECRVTFELLDTDSEAGEDPLGVERWAEYVERYIANDDTMPSHLRDQLTHKPVFLPRYLQCPKTKGSHSDITLNLVSKIEQ